jgi:uncharacterized membrane protein YraQ (UPF0718 family)
MAGGRRILDAQLLSMVGVTVALAVLAWSRGGEELLRAGLREGGAQLVRYGLLVAVSFLAAGLVQALLPSEWIRGALGRDSGLRGILLASAAGVVTPAGPFVSLPVAATLLRGGAGPEAVVAYLTAWSVLAIHRLVAWEVPILGARFALLRYAICALLPIAAGLLARGLGRLFGAGA